MFADSWLIPDKNPKFTVLLIIKPLIKLISGFQLNASTLCIYLPVLVVEWALTLKI